MKSNKNNFILSDMLRLNVKEDILKISHDWFRGFRWTNKIIRKLEYNSISFVDTSCNIRRAIAFRMPRVWS